MTDVMAEPRPGHYGAPMRHTILAVLLTLAAAPLFAHCDSVTGPVIVEAQHALDKGDVTPVLKWVRPDDEKEIRSAFAEALKVRAKGSDAKALADRWFFETLVRIHREGEGASFTGLKGADFQVEEGIELADKAIDSKSLDAAEKALVSEVTAGLRKRFAEVVKAREHADHNVEAGRHYVHAYVEFIHYAERLHQAATTSAAHGGGGAEHAKH